MDPTPVDAANAAIDAAIAISDPAERALAVTGLLDAVHERRFELRAARESAVLELRETRKLREVAELLSLSIPRVDQIAKGK
jgi:serine kinase of HPr protein (carbohydrate metabolism regulator)